MKLCPPLVVLPGTLVVFAGCLTHDTPTLATGTDLAPNSEQAHCHLGCHDEDPYPEALGVFINFYVTPELCADTENNLDEDQDGMSEYCEVRLAEAFAPRLIYASDDDVSGEPRYAVRPGDYGTEVNILYLTSMYYDFGWSSAICDLLEYPLSGYCAGHHADSEVIHLVVDYDPWTNHWFLKRMDLSQHGSYGWYDYWELSYSDEVQGRPDIWASYYKHALYTSYTECQSGGTLGSDTCSNNTDSLVLRAYPVDNVGSSMHHLLDCVYSYNPVFYGNQECHWTYSGSKGTFGGWQGTSSKAQESNGHRLLTFGF